jgi:hypothetical protein
MKCYWIAFAAVNLIGFMVLGWAGWRIYQEKPAICFWINNGTFFEESKGEIDY